MLHTFTGDADGGNPVAALTIDPQGDLYGMTEFGGLANAGAVFKMGEKNSRWVFSALYNFQYNENNSDAAYPIGGLVRDTAGAVYGTTAVGGTWQNGTVFKMQPSPTRPVSVVSYWRETILHDFVHNGLDGVGPYSTLMFDRAGNLYGTTVSGGDFYDGTVFRLTRSGGGWTETVLHSFNGADGSNPISGVVMDDDGNLYGTTNSGGYYGCGTIFELSPVGMGWGETVLYHFMGQGDGCRPWAGVILDPTGNLYGAVPMSTSDPSSSGTLFELSPSGGSWKFGVLYSFAAGGSTSPCSQGFGTGPSGTLTMDRSGALYGTTQGEGFYNSGNIFKLAPTSDGWVYTSLHDLNNLQGDGMNPCGGVSFDNQGNLYGTAYRGGGEFGAGSGVVWELTQ